MFPLSIMQIGVSSSVWTGTQSLQFSAIKVLKMLTNDFGRVKRERVDRWKLRSSSNELTNSGWKETIVPNRGVVLCSVLDIATGSVRKHTATLK